MKHVFAGALLYLWSVPLALFISNKMAWQYDGDIGWWLAMAYAFPVGILAEPFANLGDQTILIGYFVLLTLASIWLLATWKRMPN
jgi:hypothetical protein